MRVETDIEPSGRERSDRLLVVSFYRFVKLPHRAELKPRLQAYAESRGVLGTILLAEEGINGTIAGEEKKVRSVIAFLARDEHLADLEIKESWATKPPFYRMRVRLKKEIVTMGLADHTSLDPSAEAGTYVSPADWNELVDDPRVLVIDARNDYETAIGTFAGAIDPGTESFHDLPRWLKGYGPLESKPPVAMYCTGGIRCEKATAFLRAAGFDEVYHLQGGILKYLETVPESESRWQGECFVFDQRVAVRHGLELGSHDLCHACRWPVSGGDKLSRHFVLGVSCPRCHGSWTEDQLRAFSDRQRQMEIAADRRTKHLGQVLADHPPAPKSRKPTS